MKCYNKRLNIVINRWYEVIHEEGKKNEVVVIGCWDVGFNKILLVQWLLYMVYVK